MPRAPCLLWAAVVAAALAISTPVDAQDDPSPNEEAAAVELADAGAGDVDADAPQTGDAEPAASDIPQHPGEAEIDPSREGLTLLQKVATKQWGVGLVAPVLLLLVWGVRRALSSNLIDWSWVRTRWGGIGLAVVLGYAMEVALVVRAGVPMTGEVLVNALVTVATAGWLWDRITRGAEDRKRARARA